MMISMQSVKADDDTVSECDKCLIVVVQMGEEYYHASDYSKALA